MTKITCDAYVAPGFVDSGWATYSCYTDELVTIIQANVILRRVMQTTEISKVNRITAVKVDAIPNGGVVFDLNGEYVRMQGW